MDGQSRGENGFTLIEVTVGVAILSLAVTGLFLSASTTVNGEMQARSIAQTTGAAQDTATDIQTLAAYDPSILAPLADGPPQTRNGATVTVKAAGTNAYDVVVQTGKGARTVTVRTRIVQEAPPPGALLSPAPPLRIWTPPPAATTRPSPAPTATPCRRTHPRPGPLSAVVQPQEAMPPNQLPPCDDSGG